MVVLSGSMEPAFQRGDILFLENNTNVGIGDIVVFQVKDRDIPIVHRVLKVHERAGGRVDLLTKGDANRYDDRNIVYANGQDWVSRDDIQGKVVGVLRYLGFITILLNDYPKLKYVFLGIMGLFTLTSKE